MSTAIRLIRPDCCARATSGQVATVPPISVMNSRRCMFAPRLKGIVAVQTCTRKGPADVRFGSKADMCSAKRHVRFGPNSDHESGHPNSHVCFTPESGHVPCTSLCLLWAKSGHAGKRQQGRRLNADYSVCGCQRLHFLLPLAKRRQRDSSAVAKPALVLRIRAKELGLAPLEPPPLL
jgi:hypothetical protein